MIKHNCRLLDLLRFRLPFIPLQKEKESNRLIKSAQILCHFSKTLCSSHSAHPMGRRHMTWYLCIANRMRACNVHCGSAYAFTERALIPSATRVYL